MQFPRLVRPAPAQAQPLAARDDDTLMVLAQAGSPEAFAALVERHALRVVQTCFRFSGDREQARELAQGIWVTVWQSRARYRSGSDFSLWLITIARNRCRNELRRQRVIVRHTSAVSPLGPEPSAGQIDSVLVEERQRRVREALSQLPIAMREALLMRYGEELRYDEMSKVLGTQESTLRSRVHNGLKLLKRQLENRMTQIHCPPGAELIRYVDADLSPESSQHINEHLGQCPTCGQQARELRALVEDIGALPSIELDVGAHVNDVLRGLNQPAQAKRRPVIARLGAVTAMAASVGLAVHFVGSRYSSPTGTWQARGSSQGESLSRDVGVQVYRLGKSPQPLHPGDTIAANVALTAGLRNLGHTAVYVLLFAIDSRNDVHWITPKYTQTDEDPSATQSSRSQEELLLPTSVVFDDMAQGPLRIVTIISPTPVRVSQVESLTTVELSQGNLAHRFASAEVREIVVQVTNAYQGNAP